MKKMLCILTLLTVSIVFVACNQTETTPSPTAIERSMPDENIEYTIYSDNNGMDCTGFASKVVSGVKFAGADELDFVQGLTGGYVDGDIPNARDVELFGETYTTQYVFTEMKCFPENKSVAFDVYRCVENGNRYLFEINRDNGKIEFFTINPIYNPEEIKITFDEAVTKSKEYMKTMYGDNDLSGYKVDTFIDEKKDGRVYVVFTKEVAGMLISSEILKFTFDFEGNMVSAYTLGYGYMDDFYSKNITEKRVNAAEEALLSMLPKDLYVQDDRYIELDVNTGICYLSVFSEEGELYININ